MAEEVKMTAPSPSEGEKRSSEDPAVAAKSAPDKPLAPAKTVRVAAPDGPIPLPWTSPLVEKYTKQYGSALKALTYLGQNYLVVDRSLIPNILGLLRREEQCDYCVDITAVHYPKREKQFDLIWILYSFGRNERIRVKRRSPTARRLRPAFLFGQPPTGWNAKSMTCLAYASMGILI